MSIGEKNGTDNVIEGLLDMSWFDTAGFATLAKSALKEAQKTIDKALDIQEEDAAKRKKSSGEN